MMVEILKIIIDIFSMVWKHFEDFLIKDYLICILGKYNCYNDFKKKNK